MVIAKNLSDLDLGGVLKDSHDPNAHGLRIRDANSRVPSEYSKVIFTRNVLGSITEAVFYRGTSAEKTRIKFFGDVAGSLNNKYWLINSSEDAVRYYIWYNVDGTGTDPNLINKIGFEIPISANDPASLICLATRRYLENCEHFVVDINGFDVLLIQNVMLGETTDSIDVDTGFGITTTCQGITKRICSLELPEEIGIRYIFNHAERRFDVVADIQVDLNANTDSVSSWTYDGVGNSIGSVDGALNVNIKGLVVNSWSVQNISALTAGNEYSFTLAANIKRFEIKSRSGTAKIQISPNAGQSGTIFETIRAGSTYREEGLLLASSVTYYFQTNKNNEIIEVVSWS